MAVPPPEPAAKPQPGADAPASQWLDSAARYRALVDNSRDITTVLGPDATFIYQSPAISRVLGYDSDELIGQLGFDYVHPEDSVWALPLFFELLAQPGGVLERNLRFRHKAGHYIELEMVAYNMLHDPAVGGIVVNSRDISERRRAEKQILYQKTLLEQLHHASNAGILVVDSEHNYVSWNQRFKELWGLDDDTLRGGRRATLPAIRAVLRDPEAFSSRLEQLDQESQALLRDQLELLSGRVLERYSAPVRGPAGEDFGRVWFFYEVTELVKARQAAEAAEQRSTQLASLRDRLTHMVVHDIRNPLFAVSLMLEHIGQPAEMGAEDRQAWEQMRRQLDYALELCQQLLEIKRMAAGELQASPAEEELEETCRAALETLRPQADLHQVRLRSQLPLLRLSSDHALLRRIISNLLHNAIKHSPAGAEVWLRARLEEGRLMIEVQDQGPGIPAEQQARIFELFAKVEGGSNQTGTGIGLNFCALAAQALGGSITVDSAPGSGACFILSLPFSSSIVPA
ncbi:PAS domain S-box protein [bacterium]|nr:PAS domain S-box protein [bacterium]